MADPQAEARVTGLQWRVLSGICWHIANIKGRAWPKVQKGRTSRKRPNSRGRALLASRLWPFPRVTAMQVLQLTFSAVSYTARA